MNILKKFIGSVLVSIAFFIHLLFLSVKDWIKTVNEVKEIVDKYNTPLKSRKK